MSWAKRTLALALLLVLLAGLPAAAGARPHQDPWDKVDARVRESLDRTGEAEFLVFLAEEADLSGAALLSTKEAKGAYVYEALLAVAARTQRGLRAYLDARGVSYRPYYIRNMIWVHAAGPDVVLDIARRADVDHIEANPWVHGISAPPAAWAEELPLAPEWGVTKVRAPEVWAMGYNGQGVIAAGNDTGIDWDHPALAPHYRGCLNPPTCTVVDHDYNWYDAIANEPVPYDDHNHGTHTIGSVIGDDGGTNQIGVAPGAQWIGCKNMTDSGVGSPASYLGCFEFLLAPYAWTANPPGPGDPNKAPHVINNSWGCPPEEGCLPDTLEGAVQALRAAGIEVVVSAGNAGSSCNSVEDPPAIYRQSFSVGATDSSDGIASFSSRGPVTYDNETYLKPEISAPGVSVRSAIPGTGYGSMSGTSMAGPHVAGGVALVLSACPALIGQPDQIEWIITSTALPRLSSQCGPEGPPNNVYGWGRLDTKAAVDLALAQCAAQGALAGHVYDALTTNPIEDAVVVGDRAQGGSWSATTDAAGSYTMTVPEGDFAVTAEHPLYTTAVTTTVVITDQVSTVDFYLQPRGRLWGYVTAADNGLPLEGATVTADDGSAATADAAGYYELYLDAGTRTVTATMADYVPESAAVVIAAGGDTRQDFALWAKIAVVPMPIHKYLLIDTTYSTTAQIVNRQAVAYPFELYELPGGVIPGLDAAWPGPDGYGYAGEALDYDWIEISGSGTAVALDDDAYAGPFDVGFSFPFYGANQAQFYISSNGFISFGAGSSSTINQCPLPSATAPNNLIALMWDDLDPGDTGDLVYYQSFPACPVGPGACLVVQYQDYHHYSYSPPGPVAGTFQAVLYDNGSIRMQYLDTGEELGSGSTTGMEDANAPGDHGLTYACNTANSLSDGLALCYVYPGSSGCAGADVPWLGEAPPAGTVPAAGTFDVGVYFTATASVGVTQTGDYYATLVVNGSPAVRVPVTMTVVDQPIPPTASFAHNAPVCDGEEVVFTNTADLGLPPADQFLWAFGDGMTSTLAHPAHLYGGPGSYTVTLEVCNPAGCDTAMDSVAVLPAPTAGFTWTAARLTVTFTNASQDATAYLWAFGDGITSTLEHPTHTYAAAGTYTVTLVAAGDCGTDEFSALVTVTELPAVGFTHNAPVCLGTPVVLTNTSIGAETYLWTFGDGITDTVEHPVHSYAAAGVYTVHLEACNGLGCDTVTDTVVVQPLAVAAFTWAADLLMVTFTNASQNAAAYAWSFGDGGTSTATHPVHTYAAAGTYTVVLTATGVCGAETIVHDVTVSTQTPLWRFYLPIVIANR